MAILDTFFPQLALKRENAKAKLKQLQTYNKAKLKQLQIYNKMLESVPNWAADNDEDEWLKLTGADKEPYTEQNLQTMRQQARKLQYTAAGRNILQTLQDFIIGRNAKIAAADENPDVQAYWDEWAIANKWDMRSKEIIKRVFRDGECFVRWFEPPMGKGVQKIRFVNPEEIKPALNGSPTFGIDTDPDDIEKVLSYHRSYTINNVSYDEDIPADEMLHIKIMADSDVKRGISFFIGIAEYMKQYENWLKDRIILNKLRHFFNIVFKPSGNVSTSGIKDNFSDVTGKTPVGGTAKKRRPKSGSVLIAKGMDVEYPTLNINASDTKEDGRAIQLMIAAGCQFPEYITRGDASNANYASTMVSESPFVRMIESWQDFFGEGGVFGQFFAKVIDYGVASGQLPEKSEKTKQTETGTKTEMIDTSRKCQVNFATLIHRDIKAETEAYQIHRQNGWASNITISEKLGYDYAKEKEQINHEEKDEQEKAKAAETNEALNR